MSNRQFSDTQNIYTDQNLSQRRARRIQEMKKRKARQMMIRKITKTALPFVAVFLVIAVIIALIPNSPADKKTAGTADGQGIASIQNSGSGQGGDNRLNPDDEQSSVGQQMPDNNSNDTGMQSSSDQYSDEEGTSSNASADSGGQNSPSTYFAHITDSTLQLSDEIISTNALFIDLESNNILAQKAMNTVINPASMTKVLTILVAAEQIEEAQLDDTFTMTLEITDYGYVNDCSSAGFLDGEEITVRDLFYGTILPSGADAAVGLAVYTAGSHEAFIELMNEKIEELGLSDTAHMTNSVGLYDKEHHCTVYDMAMIMEAALANDICREVMTAHTYTTSLTEQHPEGILLSNWFLRRIEDKDTGGEVICAKTGYVAQSGSCAVSYGKDHAGNEYICVTANSTSSWKCIYDHVALYKKFAEEN